MYRDQYSDLPGTKASMILVLGETGAGKSFFIDKLAPGRVEIGHNLESCTQNPQLVQTKVGGTEVFLIDTPGFDDAVQSDGDILVSISRMLTAQYRLGIKLKGIIYVHNIQAPRMRKSSIRQLELFRKICGDESLGHVLLVTTGWANGPVNGSFAQRERELRTEYWAPMTKEGAKTFRFYGTRGSATSIVSQLLGGEEIVLALQREICDQNLKLNETSAGSFAAKARELMEKEYRDLIVDEQKAGDSRLSDLKEILNRSRDDEAKLQIDVVRETEIRIGEKVENELKKNGKKPAIECIISWLISLAGIGLAVAGMVGAF